MTLWIRIDANIGENPNVWKLADVRELSAVSVVGHLVMLFGNVAAHCPDGNVSDVPDKLLERWAGWAGEAGLFAGSFRELFVTDGMVDGWEKRQGALIDRAARERERMARRRAQNSTRTVREQTANKKVARNDTVRNDSKDSANAEGALAPVIAVTKVARPPKEPAPWMGRMRKAWTLGTLPEGAASQLRGVVADIGEMETADRMANYCESADPAFATLRGFIAKHAAYANRLGVDPTTGLPNAIGQAALRGGR